jgi:tight adherence protein C
MELIGIAGLLAVSIALVVYALLPGKEKDKERVIERMSGRKRGQQKGGQPAKDPAARLMARVAPFAMKPVMPRSDEQMTKLRVKLSNAGFRRENATTMFLASKSILGVGLGIGACVLGMSRGMAMGQALGLAGLVGGVGFLLPDAWLWLGKRQRRDQIRNGMPDAMDLMVISVEAGLGLDSALQRVGEEMVNVHPTLAEELRIVSLESQMGLPRAEALANLASRSGLQEMRSLVATITQAERFGTSIAKVLRNQADALRVKRRQKAEERAQKTAVKLMLPLVLFIFPSIFVVLAGPAALRMIDTFSKTGLGR